MTTFYSPNALMAQRASGYRSTTYALAEIIDNSFDAGATDVDIFFLEKKHGGRRRVEEIVILDNGLGMSADILQSALQFGKTTNTDIAEVVRSKKKGKFGFGLPNASLSQCPSVHLYSWTSGVRDANYVYLDLQEIIKSQSIEIPTLEKVGIPDYYQNFLPKLGKTGTIVSWRACDRLTNTKGETLINNAHPVLGRVYRYLLKEGKKIKCYVFDYNERKNSFTQTYENLVKPLDPLFLMGNTQAEEKLKESISVSPETKDAYNKYIVPKGGCRPTNSPLMDCCGPIDFEWKGKTYHFDVITSTAAVDVQKPGIRGGGNTRVGEMYGEKQKEGNITFVRADREITSGTFGNFYMQTEPRHRWWTIEVKFDADADDLLGVHNNKQGIEFTYTAAESSDGEEMYDSLSAEFIQARQALWAKLTHYLVHCQKTAFKLIRDQASEWDTTHIGPSTGPTGPAVPTGTSTTASTLKKVDGPRDDKLDEETRKGLLEKLSEKYPKIPKRDIQQSIDVLDKSMSRACVLYAPSEATNQLWSITRFYSFLVVLINTNHEFYLRFLGELRSSNQDGAVTAVELFLSSLAVEEDKFNVDEDAKDTIEHFRSNVGTHLHRYIKSLPGDHSVLVEPREENE
jgi:hypothetical protein